ncbi:porin family protein [Mesorhizobium sp. PAMC28654]|uniref:outer membrane protein n=1 Tax=Mesorhizobium sp. PAMC28654 TaxID=2880934 RepID=UPI001D0ACB1A|nr:outer membrane protein [Mesorhizobium sp. PAMC28654]UDL87019.1 porin family protein [Mesorhizobium sp. PAMC28654]
MKSFLFAIATLVAATGGAFAADVVTLEPPPPVPVASTYNWTGLYVGAQAGYDWAKTSYNFSNPVPSGSFTPSGFVGGLYVGYNYQFATPLVVGVEGDVDYSNVKGSFDNPFGGFSGGSAKLRWQGSARVRVGYAFDRFLPYIAGGVAVGDFRFEGGPGLGSGITPALESWNKTMTGWTIGAGVEYALADKWTARLEYRYTDFGTAHGNLAPAYSSVVETMKVRDHSVRVGVSYKF